MKIYNKISIFLFLLGSFLILNSKANITGAFIGTTIKPTLSSFFGVISLLLSGAFFYKGSSLEDKFKEPEHLTCDELISKINTIKPDTLVLDTSAISEYSPKDIEYLLKDRSRVLIPQSVLNEIKDYKMKKVLQERSQKPKNIQKYKRVAQEYLENTDKAQMYKFLIPYVKAKLEGKKNGSYKTRNRKS